MTNSTDRPVSVSSWRTYRRLVAFAKPYRLLLVAALIAALIEAAGTTGFLALMKPITDETFIYKNAEVSRWLPVQIILLFVVRGIAGYITDMAMGKSARSIARDLRIKVMAKYLRLPGSRFDSEPVPSMLIRLGSDSDQVAQAAVDAIKVMIQQSLQVIGALALMLWHSWQVTLTILVLAPVLAWVMDKVARRYRRISHSIQESGAHLLQAADQTLSSHQEVKIYGAQQTEMERYGALADRNLRLAMKVESTRGISTATVQMIGAIGLSALLFVAGAQALAGRLTAGDFVVLMTSMLTIIPGLKQLTNVQNMVQRGLASAERLFSVLDSPDEPDQGAVALTRAKGLIEFRDVTARYPGQVNPALADVSFIAQPGTVTAIVGRSGSGKSSLIKLIPRFYDAEAGQILLDGQPVQAYALADLRRQIALVGQQVMLFDGSIAEKRGVRRNAQRRRQPAGACDSGCQCDGICRATARRPAVACRCQGGVCPAASASVWRSHAPCSGRADPDPGRSDCSAGQRIRALGARRPAQADAGPHHAGDRASPVHHRTCRSGAGDGPGPDRRAWHASRIAGAGRLVFAPARHAVPRTPGMSKRGARTPGFWYDNNTPIPLPARILVPVYGAAIALRRALYRRGWRKRHGVPVPVIVVGNVTAGGTGKTPLTIALVAKLQEAGWTPGVASRGYGRDEAGKARWVEADTPVALGGDEPVLIAWKTGARVRVDSDRLAAARALVEAGCDIVICDDGLQHYRLARDVEIEVVDGQRRYGNGRLLPAGPLREPVARARDCDFRVVNLGQASTTAAPQAPDDAGFGEWQMRLSIDSVQPMDGKRAQPLSMLAGQRVHAVAGIAYPERFFAMLRARGIGVVPHAFPDHHVYRAADFSFGSRLPVLMTEKDAVKCRPFADEWLYSVPLKAELPAAFWVSLLDRLNKLASRQGV